MMFFAATTDQASATSDPLGMLVFVTLLIVIGGLVALGVRQRRSLEHHLDLEWIPLDE